MKQVLVLLAALLVLGPFSSVASDSCFIVINKRLVYKGVVEQRDAVAFIKARDLKGTDRITIVYHTESESRGWKRTFYIQDSAEENVKSVHLEKQSGSVTISATVLSALKEKKKPVFIYTISLPTDKAMAARVRVRTLFICKIEWS